MKRFLIPLLCLSVSGGLCSQEVPKSGEPGTPAPSEAAQAKWSAIAKEVMEAMKKEDTAKAFSLAQKGADAGDLDCVFFLGRMLENGWGTKADPAGAVAGYAKAAAKDHEEARANWARCLESGIGGKADPEKADFLYQQAAEAGFVSAQSRMGVLEMDGIRRPKNEKAAFEWFVKAAAQNDGVAFYRLAQCYQHGLGGVEKSVAKALENAMKGANAGNLDAVNQVGLYYQYGYGLKQDKIAAAGWFNFAAQYDHPAALSNLGQCYEAGQGFKPNLKTAARIYADAAKLNDPFGCLNLARCLKDGLGVEKHLGNAYVNFARAALLGIKAAEPLRDEVKAKLSPAELKEAEALLQKITGKGAS